MKNIYVIVEDNEVLAARNSMDEAIAAAINRMAICGYLCDRFNYADDMTAIQFYDSIDHNNRVMFIQEVQLKEGV